MKIYVVGAVSSGKSTLAKKMSLIWNVPYQPLDELVHISDKTHLWGNRKRPVEEREELFYSVIQQPNWIIEDIGRPCFEEGLIVANTILLLDISSKTRKYRIIKRWLKQRLGIEKCIYCPNFKMLLCMFKWSKDYDTGKDNVMERISPYKNKIVTLRNKKEINRFLEQSINRIKSTTIPARSNQEGVE